MKNTVVVSTFMALSLGLSSSVYSDDVSFSPWNISDNRLPIFAGELDNSEFVLFITNEQVLCSKFLLAIHSKTPITELKLALNEPSDYRGYNVNKVDEHLYGFVISGTELGPMKEAENLWIKTNTFESKVSLNGFTDAFDQTWFMCMTVDL